MKLWTCVLFFFFFGVIYSDESKILQRVTSPCVRVPVTLLGCSLHVDSFSYLRCLQPSAFLPAAYSIIPRHAPLLPLHWLPALSCFLSLKTFTAGYLFKGICGKLEVLTMLVSIISILCHIQRSPLTLLTILPILWKAHSTHGLSHLPSWPSALDGRKGILLGSRSISRGGFFLGDRYQYMLYARCLTFQWKVEQGQNGVTTNSTSQTDLLVRNIFPSCSRGKTSRLVSSQGFISLSKSGQVLDTDSSQLQSAPLWGFMPPWWLPSSTSVHHQIFSWRYLMVPTT